MIDNWKAVDLLERAGRETPFCACGEAMTLAAKPDGVWFECAARVDAGGSRISRLVALVTAPTHTPSRLLFERAA